MAGEWDELTGLLKSALTETVQHPLDTLARAGKGVVNQYRDPSPFTEMLMGGAIGGLTLGDSEAIHDYWGAREKIHQRKQLQTLWNNLHPEQPMPPGLTSPEQLAPTFHYGRQGEVFREDFGQEPKVIHEATAPPAKSQKPTVHVFPDGRQRLFNADGSYTDLPAPEGFTPKPEKVGYDYVDRLGGFVKKPGGGAGPEFIPVPGVTPKPAAAGKSDLQTSITADRMKGVGWHMPDGSSVDPNTYKTRAEALAAGAIPFQKDDETKFKQYDVVGQTAQEMLTLLPAVESRIGTKDWPTLVGRALSQKLRGAQMKTLAKQDPALAQYLERLQTLSLNMTKQVLPAGRIPVWDQQLLMGVFVSPEMNAPTQKSQLQDILRRSEASKANAMSYAKGTLGAVGGAEPVLTPEAAAAQVGEGDTFTLQGKNYKKTNGVPVPIQGALPAH